MTGPQFFETGYGRRYYDHQLPTLIDHLGDIAHELKRANDLKEKELSQDIYSNKNKNIYQILVQDAVGYKFDQNMDVESCAELAMDAAFTQYLLTGSEILTQMNKSFDEFQEDICHALEKSKTGDTDGKTEK